MPTVTVDYYGVDGTGRNVTEAKRDAGRKIELAMRGDYSPIGLTAGAETVIIFRHPLYGWEYGFLRGGKVCSSQGADQDRETVEKAARRHLGMNATNWRTCFGPADVDPVVIDPQDRKDIAEHCRWNRRYDAARQAGLDDHNAHALAGGWTNHMTQPVPEGLNLAAIA